ncbi:MAG TPA: glycosyltransferase family 39 protein [Bryobacteraceae bacterium]|jgi:mannosyltransferase
MNYAEQSSEVKDRICFAALLAVVIQVLWLLPANSSFWRDEAGTFWDVNHGLAPVLAARWLGQSPLYYLTAWTAYMVGGSSEFVLRLPSMLAMAGAAVVLYRVAIRMFDSSVALLAVLVFLCQQHVAFAANDARPYALGLLAVNTSMLLLLRWLETGGFRAAAALALGAAFVIYAHYFFGPVLLVEAVYALFRIHKGSPARLAELAAAIVIAGILVLPLAPHVLSLFHNRSNVTVPQTPSFFDFMDHVAPAVMLASIMAGLLIAYLTRFWRAGVWNFRPDHFWLVFGWAFFVPTLYFAFAISTPLKLFLPRYVLSGAPGAALLIAGGLSALVAGPARRIAATSLAAGALLAFGTWRLHGGEDWRAAADAVRTVTSGKDMPVLIVSSVSEGNDPKTLNDPNLKNLFAPQQAYPLDAKVIRLPILATGKAPQMQVDFLEQIAETQLKDQKRFVLLSPAESSLYGIWLTGRFSDRLARVEDLGDFGSVTAVLFQLQ